ncbi:MAG TPA: four helix bundle protein [Vicinamibacterales bacterium]|nr:four helix bundle protein [Vicinamibacterales bacterium]
MIVRTFEDLDAWRLSDDLKNGVYAILATTPAKRDGKFCDQIKASASSAPANIAEGFGYYDHPQFAKHVRIAIGSLDETKNHLGDGIDRQFWTLAQIEPLLTLHRRARGACTGLLRHLTSSRAPKPWKSRST